MNKIRTLASLALVLSLGASLSSCSIAEGSTVPTASSPEPTEVEALSTHEMQQMEAYRLMATNKARNFLTVTALGSQLAKDGELVSEGYHEGIKLHTDPTLNEGEYNTLVSEAVTLLKSKDIKVISIPPEATGISGDRATVEIGRVQTSSTYDGEPTTAWPHDQRFISLKLQDNDWVVSGLTAEKILK